DNLVYQTVQMPSDSSYALGYIANGTAFTGTVLKGAGHIRVTVNSDSVKVDFVSAKLPKDETASSKNADILNSYSVKNSTISGLKDVSLTQQSSCLIYPNEERTELNVLFNQPCPKGVIIRVVDLNGRAIKQFASTESVASGEIKSYKLTDSKGKSITSGVYIVSVISDNFTYSDKILMLK
ncbi:MAG: T9SS type A sorting domain-containing protein, partial [Paludibacter sp.]